MRTLPPRKKSSKAQRQEHDLCQPSGDQPGWGLRSQVLEEGPERRQIVRGLVGMEGLWLLSCHVKPMASFGQGNSMI